jgi:hypothetical protein
MKKVITVILSLTLLACGQNNNTVQDQTVIKSDITVKSSPLPASMVNYFKSSTPAFRDVQEVSLNTNLDPYELIINLKNEYVLIYDGTEISKNLLIQDMYIEREFATIRNDKLYIYYQASDGLDGTSYLACIDLKSNSINWQTKIGGFNIGEPLIIDDYVYLTSIGTIGKFSLDSGEPSWLHNDLYEKYKSNYFEVIARSEDKIIFTDDNGRKIIVDDINGKIQ